MKSYKKMGHTAHDVAFIKGVVAIVEDQLDALNDDDFDEEDTFVLF